MYVFIKRIIVAILSLSVVLNFSAAFAALEVQQDDTPGYDQIPFYFEDVLSMRRNSLLAAQKESDNAVNVSAISLDGFTIGIDAGHQKYADDSLEPIAPDSAEYKARMSGGCSGVRTGIEEYAINLFVAKKLQALFEEAGAAVVMARTENDVSLSNAERAQLMNDAQVDVWIRIHCNSSKFIRMEGALILAPYSGSSLFQESSALANAVLGDFCSTTGTLSKGTTYVSDQVGFNYSQSPVIAVEMGYLSNPQEEAKLGRDSYQALCAKGIFSGVALYLSGDAE